MTPTAVAPASDLAAEVADLQNQLQDLRPKQAAQKKVVSDLEAETGNIGVRIARGKLDPQAATEHQQKLAAAHMMLDGFNSLIAEAERRYAPKLAELNRLKAEAALTTELEEIANLQSAGKAILDRFSANTSSELARLSEIRGRLGKIIAAASVTFPIIPPTGSAARSARVSLDEQLADILEPVQRMLK